MGFVEVCEGFGVGMLVLLDFCEEVKNVDFGFVDLFLAELVGDVAAGDVLFEVGQVHFVVRFATSVVAFLE